MSDVLSSINLRTTPQSEAADPRQVPNNAGGFTFEVTPESRLRRFLILGVEGGTYYVGAKDLAKENAAVVMDFARTRTEYLVNEIVEISVAGRAPKQNPALFALAAAASLSEDEYGRRTALEALPLVARTGTHLFQFIDYLEQFRGWGRAVRRAVAGWYANKPIDDLAYQVLKYRHRGRRSHRQLLMLSHDAGYTASDEHRRLYDWIAIEAEGRNPRSPRFGQTADLTGLTLVEGYQRARTAKVADLPNLISQYRLTWEMLPEESLATPAVWEALLDAGMGQTALVRQLPRLTSLGLLSPLSDRTATVAAQLSDADRLRKGRVHPFWLLLAQRSYELGRNRNLTWNPAATIVDALGDAFYRAYPAVEPTGKRWLLGLDVSGSMGSANCAGLNITAREAAAALALVIANTEPRHQIVGFTAGSPSQRGGWTGYGTALRELAISPRQRLSDAVRVVSGLPFGNTDCALPMQYALTQGLEIDTFVVITDNETWYGTEHPHQALAKYRGRVNPNAKLIVLAMTATNFTIADPTDAGMLDIAGLDAAVPTLVSDFARGL
jgi:60 kDa SS-A/Ro ribonucleoprotein